MVTHYETHQIHLTFLNGFKKKRNQKPERKFKNGAHTHFTMYTQ